MPNRRIFFWILPIASMAIAAFLPVAIVTAVGLVPIMSACIGFVIALLATVGVARRAARFVQELEDSLRTLEKIRPASQGAERIVDDILKSAEGTREVLADNAKRTIGLVEELRESIYRDSVITGETKILKSIVLGFLESFGKSTDGVNGIAVAIDALASKVETQASAINQIGASIEEMNASIKSIAGIATKRNIAIQALMERAAQGEEHSARLDELVVAAKADVDLIIEMSGAIQEIASKTDVLSMNAAIEAAHAGEAGRGFSVVAEEIKKLSESATENVDAIAKALQHITASMASVRDVSRVNLDSFSAFKAEIGNFMQAFQEINGAAVEAATGTQEIVSASGSLIEISETVRSSTRTIRTGTESIEGLMTAVDDASRKIEMAVEGIGTNVKSDTEGIEKLAKAVLGMRDDMKRIGELVPGGGYRKTVDMARLMVQHLLWVIKARLALDGHLSADAKSLGDHTKCDLGRWMGSTDADPVKSRKAFKELDAAHRRLHAMANEIISTAEGSAVEENERRFDQLVATSKGIMEYLSELGNGL